MPSFKVEIKAKGETGFVANGIRLPSEEQGNAYAKDLWSRWSQVSEYRVVASDDEVNHVADDHGRLTRVSSFGILEMWDEYTPLQTGFLFATFEEARQAGEARRQSLNLLSTTVTYNMDHPTHIYDGAIKAIKEEAE